MSSEIVQEDVDSSKTRVGPWLNKDEFINVYNMIYGPNSDWQSKSKACSILKMWTLRRQDLTPASVLSTCAILEVQLTDQNKEKSLSSNELRSFYSNAFTRFLNYMSSILQTRYLKTMYTTAKELGIESFMVDLRHLCAHTHVVPALDVFRRSADYCMSWMKQFYWQREIQVIQNVAAQDIRQREIVEFETTIEHHLKIYDMSTEGMHKKCKYLENMQGVFGDRDTDILIEFGKKVGKNKLSTLGGIAINELTEIACGSNAIRGNTKLYCDLIFQCKYFIEASAQIFQSLQEQGTSSAPSEFILLHQNLFRSLAICGFIDSCFDMLMEICENDHEPIERRQTASFWANQIVIGFVIFQEFKAMCKTRKEKNPKFDLDLAPINMEVMTPDIRAIYKRLGVKCSGVLLFGDTVRRPWFLSFDRNYIQDRLLNINEYTEPIIERCLQLVDPPLHQQQQIEILNLIKIYCGQSDNVNMNDDRYYTLDDLEKKIGEKKIDGKNGTMLSESGHKTYGIWSEVSDDINWQIIPIGQPII